MRTQKELLGEAISRLDLIIEKIKEAKTAWEKDLVEAEKSGADDALVTLSYRIKNGAEIMKLYVNEYANNTSDLNDILVGSNFLFKEFGVVQAGGEECSKK